MNDFNSLTLALENWFEKPLSDIPDDVRQRINQNFSSKPWDDLDPDERRSVALQWDNQHDPTTENSPVRHIPYAKAMKLLNERLNATPDELALWIFLSPKDGGIAAYTNANELNPPPRLEFNIFFGNDYLTLLMGAWFLEVDIANFRPTERYITGEELLDRWSKQPYIKPRDFIVAKIHESRLIDIHPMFGLTCGSTGDDFFPPLESGLFSLSEVNDIEKEDFVENAPREEVAGQAKGATKSKASQAFIVALNKLLDEIELRSSNSGKPISRSKMPGTVENLHAVACKFDVALDGFTKRTFDDYRAGLCQFRGGKPSPDATNPYRILFQEYF